MRGSFFSYFYPHHKIIKMKRIQAILLFFCIFLTPVVKAQDAYSSYFTDKSLRIDFLLAGDASAQHVYIDKYSEEPIWTKTRSNLVAPFEYGEYLFKAFDKATGKEIFKVGFSTLFFEWRTTAEAKMLPRAYPQVVTMPFPKASVDVEFFERNRTTGGWNSLLKTSIDPTSMFISREAKPSYPRKKILDNGSPAGKVDMVFIAEGYTKDQMGKFEKDVREMVDYMFQREPYKSRKSDFNIYAVMAPSENAGPDNPGKGYWSRTPLASTFYTFGTDRYLTTSDYKAVRDAIWDVPTDAIFILTNTNVYGGGGIYNYYAMASSDNKYKGEVMIHEFGHSFAGLADEYFNSETAYEDFYNLKLEPWEPNITTLVNFDAKWKSMLPAGTPIPTISDPNKPRDLGVYEGGGYMAKGIYRPIDKCQMRVNTKDGFCPVCQQAISRMIDYFVK